MMRRFSFNSFVLNSITPFYQQKRLVSSSPSTADFMWDLLNQKKQTPVQSVFDEEAHQQSSQGEQEGGEEEDKHVHNENCSHHHHHHHHDLLFNETTKKVFDELNPENYWLWNSTKDQRLKQFGMFGFASTLGEHEKDQEKEEIPAIFKQSWTDFFVSEIPAGEKSHVPRDYNFKVPEFPPWLLRHMTVQEVIRALDEKEKSDFDSLLNEFNRKAQEEGPNFTPKSSFSTEIQTPDALFKSPEEIHSEVRRKEERAKRLLEEAALLTEQQESFTIGSRQTKRKQLEREKMKSSHTTSKKRRSSIRVGANDYYLQCVLHKQAVADPDARSMICKALHIRPDAISMCGVKDYKGDTVQHIRLENVSPLSVMRANYWIARKFKFESELKELFEQRKEEIGASNSVEVVSKGDIRRELKLRDLLNRKKYLHLDENNNNDNENENEHQHEASEDPNKVVFPKPCPYPDPKQAPLLIMSNFSYHKKKLTSGNLEGNHFRIVLRDVPASITDERLDAAAARLSKNGFPNFFGCQRFSWFGDVEKHSPAFALLNGDILNFGFRLLEFTSGKHTLRELLQRKLIYPTTFQESFRRAVVKEIEKIGILPTQLDQSSYLLSCPEMHSTKRLLWAKDLDEYSLDPQVIDHENRERNFDQPNTELVFNVMSAMQMALIQLDGTQRRLAIQSLLSFFWNLCLSERIRRFGLEKVLPGDFTVSSGLRGMRERLTNLNDGSYGRIDFIHSHGKQVWTPEEVAHASIFDVFHPIFEFHGKTLEPFVSPEVYDIMMQICQEYNLSWDSNWGARIGIKKDFMDSPRPICAKVSNFKWRRLPNVNPSTSTTTKTSLTSSIDPGQPQVIEIEFCLGKGSYANVALREFLRTAYACPGHEEVVLRPLPPEAFERYGKHYAGALPLAYEDLYPQWIPEHGMAELPDEKAEPLSIYEYEGPWTRKDEKPVVEKWIKYIASRNIDRRFRQTHQRAKELFEPALRKGLTEKDLLRYAGHTVPLAPNAPRKFIARKVFQQKMKRERDPRRRRLLAELNRKGKRADEMLRASKDNNWNPQR